MDQITRIGMDTSKRIFQLHGVNSAEQPVLRKRLSRSAVVTFFERLAPTVVAIEACGAAHYWARELSRLGHTVKLIAPQLAKPYVKRGKNDAAKPVLGPAKPDPWAEALCEAMSRPTMRFVPVKTADQQAALMLAGQRDRLVRARTRLANTIRGTAAVPGLDPGIGLIAATGPAQVEPLLTRAQADETLPLLTRELFAEMADEYADLGRRLAQADAKLMTWHRANAMSRRLAAIPGIGHITASLLVMKTPDPHAFRSGRDFAAPAFAGAGSGSA